MAIQPSKDIRYADNWLTRSWQKARDKEDIRSGRGYSKSFMRECDDEELDQLIQMIQERLEGTNATSIL